MLSISNVTGGESAASYYESSDDYYAPGSSGQSVWWGSCAKALGLKGAVDSEVFERALDGKLPKRIQLHHGGVGRRGGTDLTFSAPKSISLQAMIGADGRLFEAHRRAVSRALAMAQTEAACRVTKKGETSSVGTGSLLVARFEHDLSRDNDPQLHTHCVVINATRRLDGEWRALDNEPLYRSKMTLGALYRAELAREVKAIGYEVRVTHTDGRFELAHITNEQVRAFSQRSAAIRAFIEKEGADFLEATAWEKKLATVMTRKRKTAVDRVHLLTDWKERAVTQKIDFTLPQPKPAPCRLSEAEEDTMLTDAIEHLSERQAVFPKSEVLRGLLERAIGKMSFAEVKALLKKAEADGRLIASGDRYTTPAARQMELEILGMERGGRECAEPIFPAGRPGLAERLEGLATEQAAAATSVLLNRHRVGSIQGRAGVGKTTLMSKVREVASACGYDVQGVAPSAAAARELLDTGMPTKTIAAFLANPTKNLSSRSILVVDEAGLVASRQMHALLKVATNVNARVILVGDIAQLAAVEAGKPFAQLQAHGMATALVSQIQRQTNPVLKRAVELSVEGQVAAAVELLEKEVTELPHSRNRYVEIAGDYAALTPSERRQTRVVAGTRSARAAINEEIRRRLDLPAGASFTVLGRKDLTESERRSILSYDVGDVVQADVNLPSLGLRRGEFAKVVGTDGTKVLIKRRDGKQQAWQPATTTRLGVFAQREQELSVGDMIRFTANDRLRGVVNGDVGRVTRLTPGRGVTVERLAGGVPIVLSAEDPWHIDYGYCTTVHSSQGQTCDRVLIDADATSLASSRNAFYVAISRARQTAKIYTDDKAMLPKAMSRESVKESALELVPQRRPLLRP